MWREPICGRKASDEKSPGASAGCEKNESPRQKKVEVGEFNLTEKAGRSGTIPVSFPAWLAETTREIGI
jgi:hypothetical protein